MWKLTVVVVVAAIWVSSTIAVAPCSRKTISSLKRFPECYLNGKPPSQRASGRLGTHILISKGELPVETQCVTAYQDSQRSYVTLYLSTGSNVSLTDENVVHKSFIEETDYKGDKYRLYVIHNRDNVYTYYRCIPGNSSAVSSGTPMVDIAVGCKYTKDKAAKKVIKTAKSCFKKLNITNYISLPPCDC